MIESDLRTAAEWMSGRLAGRVARGAFRGVSTDTRTLQPGALFFALSGPNFDGHGFCESAVAQGAAAAVVANAVDADLPRIEVGDTRRALGALGAAWRRQFEVPVLAVTGSNGKTTVKECIAAILRQRGPALATRGNLNNDIGVPLMLCELDAEHEAAIFELGANHAGEIDYLARLVQPDVGLVTNAAAAHLEGFGSIEGVAHAKGEMFAALPPGGTAVIAADEEWAGLWHELAGDRRRVTFGAERPADVRVVAGPSGWSLEIGDVSYGLRFPLPGMHNRLNAAAAAAAAWAAGFTPEEIVAGLESVEPVSGRLVERSGPRGSRIIDDSYNANPGSFQAAFDVLRERGGRRWAVVGEMAELGEGTREAHERLGRAAGCAGVERLWAFGPSAEATVSGFGRGAEVVTELETLAAVLGASLDADVTLLVKGSRSNRLERLITALQSSEPVAGAG